MGKSLTKDQRKNSKYISRNLDRERKYNNMFEQPLIPVKKEKPKQKWKPHSEIEVD